MISAPDLDDTETRALAHARAVRYLDAPGYGAMPVRLNGRDPAPLDALRNHDQINAGESVSNGRTESYRVADASALVCHPDPPPWTRRSPFSPGAEREGKLNRWKHSSRRVR